MDFSKLYNSLIVEEAKDDSPVTNIPAGTILYHGTGESFDSRYFRIGGDNIFWTADDLNIARSYIPKHGSYSATTVGNIIKNRNSENLFNSLKIPQKYIQSLYDKQHQYYSKLIELEKYLEIARSKFNNLPRTATDEETDDALDAWEDAEDKVHEFKKTRIQEPEKILASVVTKRLQNLGYTVSKQGYVNVITDRNNNIIPFKYSTGKVYELETTRELNFYDMRPMGGDLMNPQYREYDKFNKLQNQGYDGVIINDYAQTETYGNYGHYSYGFFNPGKDVFRIKRTLQKMEHPKDSDWKY